jgi:hypothetical protein
MNKNRINEATGSGSSGHVKNPITFVPLDWGKEPLEPFNIPVSNYLNPTLAYDSYDGHMNISKEKANKIEKMTKRLARQASDSFSQNDDDGNPVNGFIPMGDTTPGTQGKESDLVKEDLGVWFGTKKKPKGSKQPKGPWVNICRKKEGGGHPPCGRPDASDKSYPKCRAAGVAAHMTDAQKKAACQQKRKAEKSHPKSGTGNKPKMTHYEPKNESLRDLIKQVLKESLG